MDSKNWPPAILIFLTGAILGVLNCDLGKLVDYLAPIAILSAATVGSVIALRNISSSEKNSQLSRTLAAFENLPEFNISARVGFEEDTEKIKRVYSPNYAAAIERGLDEESALYWISFLSESTFLTDIEKREEFEKSLKWLSAINVIFTGYYKGTFNKDLITERYADKSAVIWGATWPVALSLHFNDASNRLMDEACGNDFDERLVEAINLAKSSENDEFKYVKKFVAEMSKASWFASTASNLHQ